MHFKGKLAKGSLNAKSYMFYEPAIDVCLRLYDKTGEVKFLDQALEWSSESKGNDFYDLIRGEQAMISSQIPDSVREKDDTFQQELAALESKWYDARDDEEKLIPARQELDSVKNAYRDWLTDVETAYPKYFELLHANSGNRSSEFWEAGA